MGVVLVGVGNGKGASAEQHGNGDNGNEKAGGNQNNSRCGSSKEDLPRNARGRKLRRNSDKQQPHKREKRPKLIFDEDAYSDGDGQKSSDEIGRKRKRKTHTRQVYVHTLPVPRHRNRRRRPPPQQPNVLPQRPTGHDILVIHRHPLPADHRQIVVPRHRNRPPLQPNAQPTGRDILVIHGHPLPAAPINPPDHGRFIDEAGGEEGEEYVVRHCACVMLDAPSAIVTGKESTPAGCTPSSDIASTTSSCSTDYKFLPVSQNVDETNAACWVVPYQ